MTNLEFYKDKILKNINNSYSLSCAVCCVMNNFDIGIENGCSGVMCKAAKAVEWMLAEHKEPIKLKQWEYDLIRTNDRPHECNVFESFNTYRNMKAIGYFEGITDTSMTLKEILENCEVVE